MVTQQERRQYFAAQDQEEKVHLRSNRNLRHLPHDRSELRIASDRKLIRGLDHWLDSQAGESWSKVNRELAKFPFIKTSPSSLRQLRKMAKARVIIPSFLKDGAPWYVDGYRGEQPLMGGLYVHPETGILCKMYADS